MLVMAYIINVTNILVVSLSVPLSFKNTQNHAFLQLKFITGTFVYPGVQLRHNCF